MDNCFKKSSKIADELRTKGNSYFIRRQYLDALTYYNQSLCYAEPETESLALAFANRSSVYLESKLFRKCLKNIQLAKDYNYPKDKLKTLIDRETKCLNLMKIHHDKENKLKHWDYFKLSHPANKKIPYIADCLEVKSNQKYGRYIITNKDLKVGDIVSIEEPSCQLLFDNSKGYSYCVRCCTDQYLDLLPCTDCVTTMFCSEECKDAAMKSFHKYECKHQEALSKVSLHGRFAYRLFFKTLSMFDDSIEGVEKFIIKSKNTEITIFDLDLNSVDKLENDKSRLLAMIALNKDDMSYCDKNSGSLIEGVFQGKHEIGQYFLNHVENMSKLHSHRIDSWSLDKKNSIHSTNELDSFGTYLFGALLNHSCIPNVRGFYVENRIVMYVKQPIRKGQQLFECYNTLYVNTRKDVRQGSLLNYYHFICDCEACVENYPTFENMKKVGGNIYSYAMNSFNELKTLTKSQAQYKLKKHCEMIQNRPNLSNTYEGAIIQDCILSCMMILIKTFQFE